jgi:hypothetical protein
MTSICNFPRGNEKKFNKWLVQEYFKHGSVDEVLKVHKFDIPISYAQYQRVLDKWDVVKAAGPNNKITEALDFFYHFAQKNIPLEEFYKRMPPSFRTSAATMYRILGYVKEGITRRMGTAVILSNNQSDNKVLIGNDISTPRIELGKPYGSVTIPMTFSRKRDLREDAIMRVLQQEVFTQKAVDKKIPKIIPTLPKPFMFLDIADVRVEIFHIKLPKRLSNVKLFSSYKMKNYKFINIDNVEKRLNKKLRVGILEAMQGYKKYLKLRKRNLSFNPLQYKSNLNYYLAQNVVEF